MSPDNMRALAELWSDPDTSLADIAQVVGCSVSYVSSTAASMGLESRRDSISDETRSYAVDEATKRKIKLKQLKRRILGVVFRDKLVDAILDDAAPLAPTMPAGRRRVSA